MIIFKSTDNFNNWSIEIKWSTLYTGVHLKNIYVYNDFHNCCKKLPAFKVQCSFKKELYSHRNILKFRNLMKKLYKNVTKNLRNFGSYTKISQIYTSSSDKFIFIQIITIMYITVIWWIIVPVILNVNSPKFHNLLIV